MVLAINFGSATWPDWISAISTAIIALGVLAAAPGWIRRQFRELRDPGQAPGGKDGELRETIEDAIQAATSARDSRRFRKERRDEHGRQTVKSRWQRFLRRRERTRVAREYKKATKTSREVEEGSSTTQEDENNPDETYEGPQT